MRIWITWLLGFDRGALSLPELRDFWMPRPLPPPFSSQAPAGPAPLGSWPHLSPPRLGWAGRTLFSRRGLESKMEIFSWQPHLLNYEANLM